MHYFVNINETHFVEMFKPTFNRISPTNHYRWNQPLGTLYEAHGEQLEFVQSQPKELIWTLIERHDETAISSGFYLPGSLGFFICQHPFPENITFLVRLPLLKELRELSISSPTARHLKSILEFVEQDDQLYEAARSEECDLPPLASSLREVRLWLRINRL